MCIPTVPITLRRLLTRTLSLRTSAVVSSVRTAPIVDEHVVRPVGVPGHEVGSYRLEGDEPAVGADRRIRAMAAVRLVREAVDAHPLGGAGNAVVDEHVRGGVVEAIHVLGPVGVPGHEVGGGRGEGHEAAVGADCHAHALGGAGGRANWRRQEGQGPRENPDGRHAGYARQGPRDGRGHLLVNERQSVATNEASRLMTFCPHWVISNASTTTYAPLEAGFCWPVTSIVRVWPVAARVVALKTTAWAWSVGEYVSTSATRTPSRNTRAIPVWGPRKPIQSPAVPVKANAACPPAVVETTAVPPLHALGSA